MYYDYQTQKFVPGIINDEDEDMYWSRDFTKNFVKEVCEKQSITCWKYKILPIGSSKCADWEHILPEFCMC